MKRTLALAAASVCLMAALPAQAALVVNGDFETGSLAPWTQSIPNATVVSGQAHSGTYAAQLAPASQAAGIQQSLTLVGGQEYVLDFWAKRTGTGGLLSVLLDGVPGPLETAFSTTYKEYSWSITPSASGDLIINWNKIGTGGTMYIDDVSLTAVPEPTTMIAGALLLLPFAGSTLRFIRKNRTA
jgi:hypothetical protein